MWELGSQLLANFLERSASVHQLKGSAAQPALFGSMHWGSACVLGETRRRLMQLGLTWEEPALLWDLDVPADLDRVHGTGLIV